MTRKARTARTSRSKLGKAMFLSIQDTPAIPSSGLVTQITCNSRTIMQDDIPDAPNPDGYVRELDLPSESDDDLYCDEEDIRANAEEEVEGEYIHERREYLAEAERELGEDDVPHYECERRDISFDQLNRWLDMKTRNHNFTWHEQKIFVKYRSLDARIKITQWNSTCAKSVWIKGPSHYHRWEKIRDRCDINEVIEFDEHTNSITLVHSENLRMPHNHAYGQEVPDTHPRIDRANRRQFGRKQRQQYHASAYFVSLSDHNMWQFLGNEGEGEITFDAFVGCIKPHSSAESALTTVDGSMSSDHDECSSDVDSATDDAPTSSGHSVGRDDADVDWSRTALASEVSKHVLSGKQVKHHQRAEFAKRLVHSYGCKTLIMEVFAGAFILTSLALGLHWPCSQPVDVLIDGIDLTTEKGRKIVDQRIEEDDPFCIIFPFPCGPWNSLTEFNASRFQHVRERVDKTRLEHIPMLKWMVRTAKERVRRGRIALLENPATSRAYSLDFLEDLEGTEDGTLEDVIFEYIIGDQCMLGQHDRETLVPFRGRTKWGTNSPKLKRALGILCDGLHMHQQIMGSNSYGLRSQQKAEWPVTMCRIILGAIVKELKDRTSFYAFPAEVAVEENLEKGPVDHVDEDAADAPTLSGHSKPSGDAPMSSGHTGGIDDGDEPEGQTVGSKLSKAAEREMELLDSLKLVGFPNSEQARREAWMKLPREARASIRRLHISIGHKPRAVMTQIMRGAKADRGLIDAVKWFRCETCDANADSPHRSKVAAPPPYAFNYEVQVDVFFVHDMNGEVFGVLSVICNGTTFHQAAVIMVGHGVPSSDKCYRKFDSMWTRWAGWPRILTSDRGLHNRGAFSRGLLANGVVIRQVQVRDL